MRTNRATLIAPGETPVRRRAPIVRLLAAILLAAVRLQAATVNVQISGLGGNVYHFDYLVTGIQIQVDQEVDIRFDPALFGALSNPSFPAGFDVVLFQPDNPPGSFGDYSALALVNSASPLTFGVDAVYHGSSPPGPQPFLINQFDSNGRFVSVVESGVTQPVGQSSVPEPGSWAMAGAGVLLYGVWRATRQRVG
jgi:hypothetical protein